MATEITLRDVQQDDLPIFFANQLDPDANHMAAFPSRTHDEFMAHWAKVLAETSNIVKTIIFRGAVAGNIGSWRVADERYVGYWLGKEFWGKGIASAALAQFLGLVRERPLHARVVKHNVASIRVLHKCGSTIFGEDSFRGPDGELEVEFIMLLAATEPT